jgi:hypothetical protein
MENLIHSSHIMLGHVLIWDPSFACACFSYIMFELTDFSFY